MAEENLVEGIEADDVYVGNGVAREFPITFTFSNESEVAVFLNGQVIRRGYKVEDGNVVFTIAPANGDVVSILKATAPEYIGGTEKEPEDNGYGNIYIQTDQDQLEVTQIAGQVNYVGNGVTTDFPTTFSFENSNEVVVYVNSRLVRSGYTVNNEAVVFDEAPANGDSISILKIDLSEYVKEDEKEDETEEEESSTVYDQASQEHIKINPVQTKVKYTGNGAVYEFPTIFAFFEDDNVVVYLNGSIINSGYSVTGVGETDGGLVIFDTPPAEGDKIVILRKVVVERVTDFQEGGSFRAKNINDELDRMTAFCQQIEEEMSRCVKVEVTDDQDPKELIDKVFDQLDLATEVGEAAIKTAEETAALVDGVKATIETETEIAIERVNIAAEDNIEKSRIWAEGEQAEVQELGGELSSRGFADFAMAIANTPEDVPLEESKLIAMDIVKGPKGDKGDKGEDGSGVQLGDIGFAAFGIDETLNLRRYLNGQIILQSQFVSFTELMKKRIELYPNLFTTESNWQAEVTNSKLGQCGKFVVDDEAGTIRLPKVININGLTDIALIGGIKGESLPNITGSFSGRLYGAPSGAFEYTVNDSYAGGVSGSGYGTAKLNASRSSSTYQNNAPVQQEAIQYPYFIQVATGYGANIDVTNEIQLNNPFSLFDVKWADHQLNNASWVVSNGGYISGTVYISAYNELVSEYNKGTDITDGSVSYRLTPKGYRIALSSQDSIINTLFDSKGIAWYYILDTENARFKLPRTKYAFVGTRSGVGAYVDESLPNITGGIGGGQFMRTDVGAAASGAFKLVSGYYNSRPTGEGGATYAADFNASRSSSVYKDGAQVQQRATEMYLYFYVGDTVQDANLIAASNVLTSVNNLEKEKANKDFSNISSNIDYVVESYRSGNSWYKRYKSGWLEQGGYSSSSESITITLLKPFTDTSYSVFTMLKVNASGSSYAYASKIKSQTTTNFNVYINAPAFWRACGQGA